MLTAEMLNHPSTAPHTKRDVYLPRLRMQFTLLPHPVGDAEFPVGTPIEGWVSLAIVHPNDPTDTFSLNVHHDDIVIIVQD